MNEIMLDGMLDTARLLIEYPMRRGCRQARIDASPDSFTCFASGCGDEDDDATMRLRFSNVSLKGEEFVRPPTVIGTRLRSASQVVSLARLFCTSRRT